MLMETNTIIWISLSCIWLILFVLNLKAYFFQRTIHKIHMRTGFPMKNLSILVPTSYSSINLISKLRWVALIALFFYNWIAALVCLAIEFILPIVFPEEDDHKNITVMREELKRKGGLKSLDDLLKEIMDKL